MGKPSFTKKPPAEFKRQSTTAVVQWDKVGKDMLGRKAKTVTMAVTELERRGLVAPMTTAARKSKLLVDPRGSQLAATMDICTALALVFTVIVTPFEVSFLSPPDHADGLFVINRMVDSLFFADMVLQFFLMYPTSGSNLDGSKWEDDHRTIAFRYLGSWFFIDLFSIGVSALDIYGVSSGGSGSGTGDISKFKALRVIRVLRLVKLARLLRASRMLKRWENRLSINYGMLSIMRVGFTTVCLAHLSACAWSLQTAIIEDLGESWVAQYGYCVREGMGKPNVSYVPAPGGVEGWQCRPAGNMYVASIYWAVMTITSIGYGDITATHGNATEQLLCTFLMILNSVMWGRVIATFCEVLSTMNPATTDFRITMDNLNRFVANHALPAAMSQRLRDYFHRTQHLQRTTAYRSVLLRMSPTLQGELLWHTNRAWLRRVPWLRDAETGFITQLVLALKPMVFAPSELATGNMLYVVHRGVAIYGGRMLRAGGVWGEDMLISSEKLRCKWCARAITYLEVYMISRAELLMIARKFQDTYRRIRYYTIRVALRRGIMLIAKLRLDQMRREGGGDARPNPSGKRGDFLGITGRAIYNDKELNAMHSLKDSTKTVGMLGIVREAKGAHGAAGAGSPEHGAQAEHDPIGLRWAVATLDAPAEVNKLGKDNPPPADNRGFQVGLGKADASFCIGPTDDNLLRSAPMVDAQLADAIAGSTPLWEADEQARAMQAAGGPMAHVDARGVGATMDACAASAGAMHGAEGGFGGGGDDAPEHVISLEMMERPSACGSPAARGASQSKLAERVADARSVSASTRKKRNNVLPGNNASFLGSRGGADGAAAGVSKGASLNARLNALATAIQESEARQLAHVDERLAALGAAQVEASARLEALLANGFAASMPLPGLGLSPASHPRTLAARVGPEQLAAAVAFEA